MGPSAAKTLASAAVSETVLKGATKMLAGTQAANMLWSPGMAPAVPSA